MTAPLRIGRVTLDILGAIPVAPVRVRAWVERPGTRISLLAAEMVAARPGGSDRAVARASAWLLATSDTADVAPTGSRRSSKANRSRCRTLGGRARLPGGGELAQATRLDNGSAVVWLSPLVPLVDAEQMTEIQRLALVVDCANGAGAAIDPAEFVFMNTDTAMHLHRVPVGNDFALRARGSIGPDGIGVTTAEIFDRQGFIGTCAQTLFVLRRSEPI